jgi:hypothetical protein
VLEEDPGVEAFQTVPPSREGIVRLHHARQPDAVDQEPGAYLIEHAVQEHPLKVL